MPVDMQSYNTVFSDARAGYCTKGGCGTLAALCKYGEHSENIFHGLHAAGKKRVGAAWAFAKKRIPDVRVNSQWPQPHHPISHY